MDQLDESTRLQVMRHLRMCRQARGIKAQDVAPTIGISPATLSAYELGVRPAPWKRIEKYSLYLGLKVDGEGRLVPLAVAVGGVGE